MSFETIELWRPRRDPERQRRTMITALIGIVMLAGSATATLIMRRPLLLVLGLAAALALACASWWLRGGAPEWVALLPRRWVPRGSNDRRTLRSGEGRRGPARAPAAARDACKPQRVQRTVAIGGPPRV